MKRLFPLLLIFLSAGVLKPQVVYETLSNDIYTYLGRLSQKGITDLNDHFKPLSRKYIAEKLLEIKQKSGSITRLEREELEFYLKDYSHELDLAGYRESSAGTNFMGSSVNERFRFFSYSDNNFKFNMSPLIGYEAAFRNREKRGHGWNGLNTYGYFSDIAGFRMDFRLNNEKGSASDPEKIFTPETGVISSMNSGNNFDYNEIKTMAAADWAWGSFSAGKDFIEYGYGRSGKLILSSKAPSFPFFRLELKPAEWFTFNYFHGWLSSSVIDSVKLAGYSRDIYRDKYFAWHSVVFTPLKGLDISIGESVVYSDKLEFSYLMPFMFFHLADKFISDGVNKPGDANTQIFLTFSSRNNIKNTHLYGTLFIDEITIPGMNSTIFIDENIVNGFSADDRFRTQLGFSFGASVADIPFDDMTFTAEYTRINPFVYGHHAPAQTYTSSAYLMGHWMGHNGDLVYLQLDYNILRGMRANAWWEYIRKGSGDFSGQYKRPQPGFLFGLKNYYTWYGLNLKYEIIHEFFVYAEMRFSSVSLEQEGDYFKDSFYKEISAGISYGL